MNYDPEAVREGALETAYIWQRRAVSNGLYWEDKADSTGETRQGRVLPAQQGQAITTVSITFT